MKAFKTLSVFILALSICVGTSLSMTSIVYKVAKTSNAALAPMLNALKEQVEITVTGAGATMKSPCNLCFYKFDGSAKVTTNACTHYTRNWMCVCLVHRLLPNFVESCTNRISSDQYKDLCTLVKTTMEKMASAAAFLKNTNSPFKLESQNAGEWIELTKI